MFEICESEGMMKEGDPNERVRAKASTAQGFLTGCMHAYAVMVLTHVVQ